MNLPVANLERSTAFFAKLGFSYHSLFTDETAACMLVGEHAVVMLLSREKLYSRSFFDLDGHGWQVMWMDPAAAEQAPCVRGRHVARRVPPSVSTIGPARVSTPLRSIARRSYVNGDERLLRITNPALCGQSISAI